MKIEKHASYSSHDSCKSLSEELSNYYRGHTLESTSFYIVLSFLLALLTSLFAFIFINPSKHPYLAFYFSKF